MIATDWPEGYTPHPDTPPSAAHVFAMDHFAQQIEEAANAWAKENVTDENEQSWIDTFGEWCAERARGREIGNYRMPNFKTWWKAYYAEPIWGASEDDEEDDDRK